MSQTRKPTGWGAGPQSGPATQHTTVATMIPSEKRPTPVHAFLIAHGKPAETMWHIQRTLRSSGATLVSSCIRGDGKTACISAAEHSLCKANIMLLAPSHLSRVKDSTVFACENALIERALELKVPIVLFLDSWDAVGTPYLPAIASHVKAIIARTQDETGGALDVFGRVPILLVPDIDDDASKVVDMLRAIALH